MHWLMKLLRERRKTLQSLPWLRPVLLVIDFILLVAGLFINPILGFVLGLLFILLNEWLTPVLVQRVFIMHFSGELRPTGTLTNQVIRHSPTNDADEDQN